MNEADQVMTALADWSQPCVLATIVRTEGSSYRRPGAMLLIGADGRSVGAVSGGCIEQEIARQARPVMRSGNPELIQYDGRYTLGCNGTLFILLERVNPGELRELLERYSGAFKRRERWFLEVCYEGEHMGSAVRFADGTAWPLSGPGSSVDVATVSEHTVSFEVQPSRRLLVFGNELDARQLASFAAAMHYRVELISHPRNPAVPDPDALYCSVICAPVDAAQSLSLDGETSAVLMTHSYSRDLGYLESLLGCNGLHYLGLVGPRDRADSLISDLLERGCALPEWLDEVLYAPAGLDLGSELPAEIAMSILAEVQTRFSGHGARPLRDKTTGIHEPTLA